MLVGSCRPDELTHSGTILDRSCCFVIHILLTSRDSSSVTNRLTMHHGTVYGTFLYATRSAIQICGVGSLQHCSQHCAHECAPSPDSALHSPGTNIRNLPLIVCVHYVVREPGSRYRGAWICVARFRARPRARPASRKFCAPAPLCIIVFDRAFIRFGSALYGSLSRTSLSLAPFRVWTCAHALPRAVLPSLHHRRYRTVQAKFRILRYT